jgi:ABC-type Fe3+ transport system permease subunit
VIFSVTELVAVVVLSAIIGVVCALLATRDRR